MKKVLKAKFSKPPLTYYGGKQMMLPHLMPHIPKVYRTYDEPFFGGGALFFALPPAKVEFINDTNGEIVNFYRVLKTDFEALQLEVDYTLHSEFQHRQAIEIYRNSDDKSSVLRAWAVWVLSPQSFYSIFCNSWKCSRMRNMAGQIQTKKEQFTDHYVNRLERTSIFSRDALSVIASTDSEDTFHYVDPPYFNADMGHYGGYTLADFTDLLELLSQLKGKFLLSSYPSEILTEFIEKNGWYSKEIEMQRCAGKGRKVEVLTMNYIPDASEEAEDVNFLMVA